MQETIEVFLSEEPIKWVEELPLYQRDLVSELLATGISFEEVAQAWITASAENTYRFSASNSVGDKGRFLENLKREVREFLCGGKKYKKERDGLFGENSSTRAYIVSAMSVAIASHLSLTATFIAPLITLVLASIGKVTLNAWCATE